MKFKACLFDLDGVLVDTAIYHYQAWKKLANTLGFDFTEAQNEQLKGISRMESLSKILQWGKQQKSEAEMLELATLKNNWYVAMIADMQETEVLPGTVAFLETIKNNGYKIALGSASKNAALILERTKLTHFFDAIVDGNLVKKSKPNPEVFLKGAELLKLQPEQCIVFEDAVAGIAAAKAAQMKVIGVGDAKVLTEADIVVKDLSHLSLSALEELGNL